ncbi:hypothetical protein DFH09DRAFT_1196725 [Mycena vulgaris]|nr:hypothetical protein DFH09DRAFT_1196725 [Mycena vulgaris]
MLTPVGLLLLLSFTFILSNAPSFHVRARSVPRPNRSTFVRRDATASGLSSASWIWTSNTDGTANSSAGNAAFLKTFATPSGQTASSAVISITAVDHFALWVNGHPIGFSGTAQDEWKTPEVFRAQLNASVNVFSVLVLNSFNSAGPLPGLLASVQVAYTDSTTSTFISDSSWTASRDIPSDFPTPADPSRFAPAAVAAAYGSGSWGGVTLPATDPNPLGLTGSTWVWSTPNANGTTAAAIIGFRKTFSTPSGKNAKNATVLLTVDNTFNFYVNGAYTGAPPPDPNNPSFVGVWEYAQQFTVPLNPTSNVFTVIAQNLNDGAAGLIGAIKVFYDDGTTDIIRSDSSWQYSPNFESTSTFLVTPDNLLSPSVAQGPLGISPWGGLFGISDGLTATLVPTAPFTSNSTNPSASPSGNSLPASGKHSVPIGAIVGPIVAVVFVVALLVISLLVRRRRRDSSRAKQDLEEPKPFTPVAPLLPPVAPTTDYTDSHTDLHTDPSDASVYPPSQRALPVPPSSKVDMVTVMRMNGMHPDSEPELPPPSYTYSSSSALGTASSALGSTGEASR